MTIDEPAETPLCRAAWPLVQAHPDKSGIAALAHGRDALAARKLLTNAAERPLDVKYYVWHNDVSGTSLFETLRRAADRGVQVRRLLDDNNTAGLGGILAILLPMPASKCVFPIRPWALGCARQVICASSRD